MLHPSSNKPWVCLRAILSAWKLVSVLQVGKGKLAYFAACDTPHQGVKNIKAAEAEGRADGLKPVYVFIAPPSLEELESRLRGRHTENETEILR